MDVKCSHTNCKDKKSGISIFITDKVDFKSKAVVRNKKEHYLMVKGSTHQEDVTIIHIHAKTWEHEKMDRT